MISALSCHFTSLGYTVSQATKPFRHYILKATKNSQDLFIKVSGRPELNDYIHREITWNQSLTSQKLSFLVPPIITTGVYDLRSYLVTPYFPSLPLGILKTGPASETLLLYLPQMAKIIKEIISLSIPKENVVNPSLDLAKIKSWINPHNLSDSQPLYDYLQAHLNSIKTAPHHGDFVPHHLLATAPFLTLTDAEHSNFTGVKYYDLAYCYHRLYTKYQSPHLAQLLLVEFVKIYPQLLDEKQSFMTILAQRLIGGFFDAQSDNITSLRLQRKLAQSLFAADIFP